MTLFTVRQALGVTIEELAELYVEEAKLVLAYNGKEVTREVVYDRVKEQLNREQDEDLRADVLACVRKGV